MSVFNDEFDDEPTEGTCFHCDERVELYAPGESYTIRLGMPVHLKCADEMDEEVTGPLIDYDGAA